MHLAGRALEWHQTLMRSKEGTGGVSWKEYLVLLKNQFGHRVYNNPIADLKRLYQSGSLDEYLEAFDANVYKVALTEEDLMSMFISGLKDDIGYPVLMQQPKSLQQAYALAKIQDAYLNSQKHGRTFNPKQLMPNPPNTNPFKLTTAQNPPYNQTKSFSQPNTKPTQKQPT